MQSLRVLSLEEKKLASDEFIEAAQELKDVLTSSYFAKIIFVLV